MSFPDEEKESYPLIIASHGSLNWREHHLKYLELMRQAGFAVFAMHPFDSRGTNSTVGDQINMTLETVVWDMAMALKMLLDDPRIDNRKFLLLAGAWEALQHCITRGYLFNRKYLKKEIVLLGT